VNPAGRLATFGLAALVALGGGAAIGAAAGPAPVDPPATHSDHEEPPMSPPTTHDSHGADAHRIRAASTVVEPGAPTPFTFEVLDPLGAPITSFEDRHERPMHLILVSNDLTGYAHLHPRLAGDGTWTAELPALVPGGYRLIADTVPVGGPDLVLTVDLVVPGTATARPLPEPAGTVTVEGFEVTLELVPSPQGPTAELVVRRAGAVIEPDPYLGARGHLVAIGADDLGYLHVHPTEGSGPVSFAIASPAPGRHRLYFDFSVDGKVHTAAFTVDIDDLPDAVADHAHADGERHS
jgi:hypothetical protein